MNKQGTEAWRADKAGVLSASNFKIVLSGSQKARECYYNDLHQEIEDGLCKELPNYRPLAHGKLMEDRARATYELAYGVDIDVPGFIKHPYYPFIGASSDGLIIGQAGCIEIKCPVDPSRHNIVRAGVPEEHLPQIHGNIWILEQALGREIDYCDFISYMPGQPQELIVDRVHKDPDYNTKLEVANLEFWEYICTGVDPKFDGPINLF